MKKYILSIFLVAILFAFSFERGEATTCLPGGTLRTFSFGYGGDCTYLVEYCEYYDATTNTYVIDVVSITIPMTGIYPCGGVSINTAFMNLVKEKAISNFYTHHSDPMTFAIPPCPSQSTFLVAFKAVTCWYSTLVNDTMVLKQCETEGAIAYCRTTYTICRDMATGTITKTQVSSSYSTGYACTGGFPDISEFNAYGVSPCFAFDCW